MPAVKNVGEPCAREPHARFDVAAGGNQTSRASTRRAVQAPLADPTAVAGAGAPAEPATRAHKLAGGLARTCRFIAIAATSARLPQNALCAGGL
jgi:hypothetical protein